MSLTIEELNGVLIVKFTRPEIRNPLSVDVINSLQRLFNSINTNVEKLIFTGAGDTFASGADLREIGQLDAEKARVFAIKGQFLMNTISDCKALTIAALNGYCFGGGLDLALACNKRIAATNAVFSHPGVGLGIITGWGGTQRLPRLIGETNALEMFLTGGRFDANWASRVGLIDKIVDDPLNSALRHVD